MVNDVTLSEPPWSGMIFAPLTLRSTFPYEDKPASSVISQRVVWSFENRVDMKLQSNGVIEACKEQKYVVDVGDFRFERS